MELEKVLKIVKKNTSYFFPEEEFVEKYKTYVEGKRGPLRVKFGADPTRPDLHLGHYVSLRKLKDLQDLGFEIIMIIGDFTAMIGDPSGRSKARPRLTPQEVKENARTYFDQVFKVLDREKTRIEFNSRWLSRLSPEEIVELAAKYTVSRMLERDDFHKRMELQEPIYIHEFLYPLFQAYDSVFLEADIEVGGHDQVFNFALTRDIQKAYGQEPEVILTVPLLIGLDGVKKMSKSEDNYIAFNDTPEDMYGKVMSIRDELMEDYYRLVLYYDEEQMEKIRNLIRENPLRAKERLAYEITRIFHGEEGARRGKEHFDRVFRKRDIPEDVPVYRTPSPVKLSAVLLGSGLVSSKNEFRRLLSQGSIRINGEKVFEDVEVGPGVIIRVGKRRFVRVESS